MSQSIDLYGQPVTHIPELNINLDGVTIITTHPDNVDILNKYLDKHEKETSSYIFRPRPIKIIASPYVKKYTDKDRKINGKTVWERGKVLPDCRFITWVDDLENPPSWAIYFGLVKPAKELAFYVNQPMSYFKGGL